MELDSTPYLLERMESRHVPTVAAIEQQTFTQPWSASAFMREVSDNRHSEFLVLRYMPWIQSPPASELRPAWRSVFRGGNEDASVLGYGGLWLVLEEAHICTLAVREAWRGRGLGELVLAALIERAYVRGGEFVTLEVRRTNLVAQGLYQKYGFLYSGVRKGYYLDNHEDAFIMTTPSIRSPEYRHRYERLVQSLEQRLRNEDQAPPIALESRRH